MRKYLVGLSIIVLLVSACGSAKTTATQTSDANPVQIPQVTGSAATARATEPTRTPQASEEAGTNSSLLAATRTPYPTQTLYPTYTPRPTNTPAATATPVPTPVETAISTEEAPTTVSASQTAQTLPVKSATASTVELTRIADPDPAPPLTILVGAIRIAQNGNYRVTGTVRNDSSETYGGIGVIATFYEEEKPCTERQVTRRKRGGGEETVTEQVCDYNWHGPVEVYATCMLLEPGAECPFSLEIYPEDYVSYLLHPEGAPVAYSQPVNLALSNLNVYNNGLGYVRVTGTVTNANSFAVRNAQVTGTLLDAAGQIANLATIAVPQALAPGASASFDLRIPYEPYASYQVSAQGIQN